MSWIDSYYIILKEQGNIPLINHIPDEQLEERDTPEMQFLLAEYNLLKLHTVTYLYTESEYKDVNNPSMYFGTKQELEKVVSSYYDKLEKYFNITLDGDLFVRRNSIIKELYKVDLDTYLFEDIEKSINELRSYNEEVLKKYKKSQEAFLKMHDDAKKIHGEIEKQLEVKKIDQERYNFIDEKISPLIYESYQKIYDYAHLPHYILRTHTLFLYHKLTKEQEILSELNAVFTKLYTFIRYSGMHNQSSFFGDEDIPQLLAQKHFDFLSVDYEYDLFPYPISIEGYIERLMECLKEKNGEITENSISFNKYYELFGQLVLCRKHFYHSTEDVIDFDNYEHQIPYNKLLEMPGLVMNDIVPSPMPKEEFLRIVNTEIYKTRYFCIEAYTNEYLYLHGKFSQLIEKLTKIHPKYNIIKETHTLLTKNHKAYRGHELSFEIPKMFIALMEFLKSHPFMRSFYGALYLLMQKMSIDELQDIFPKELTDIQKEIYSDWENNMVECIKDFEKEEHPDFLGYFGVRNYVKEKNENIKQTMLKLSAETPREYDMVTDKVITDPDEYSYKGFFDYNLKNNFKKAYEELQSYDKNDIQKNQEVLSKLLYQALWDTVSREQSKDVQSGRWYELLKLKNSANLWRGIFAEFSYERFPSSILKMIASGYNFEKNDIFNTVDIIPQYIIVRALYYMSRYQSSSKESMISFVNMVREFQLEKCDVKNKKYNLKKLKEIDFGFKISDFDVQLYPFSTKAVKQYMLNSQDNKVVMEKTIKLFCEGDINEDGSYNYTKALDTRYLFNDRNVYTHDALSKHVKELLSTYRWKSLLEVLDEFRRKVILSPLKDELTYVARLGRVRSRGGSNPNIVFVLHVDQIIKFLMRNIMEFVNKEFEIDIPIEFPSSNMTESYADKFIKQAEPHLKEYKNKIRIQYKDKDIKKMVEDTGVSEEQAQKKYNKNPQIMNEIPSYPKEIKEELEILLNVALSTHTTNEYGQEKKTTNYDIWIQHRPQILLYFIAVLQQLSALDKK